MEPRIQYAKTKDGVNIAFSDRGQGFALVRMPNIPFAHIQLEWHRPYPRDIWENLAERWRIVLYDNRGSGLSEREVTDFSLESQLSDLEAVLDRLSVKTFALWGSMHMGPVAITYAA